MIKKKTFHFCVLKQFDGRPLDHYICQQLNESAHLSLSRKKCKQLIENGEFNITVNRKKINKASYKVKQSDNVEIVISLKLIKDHSAGQEVKDMVHLSNSHIIWEDKQLLIASKPKGLPSLQTLDPKRDHFLAAIKRLIKKRDGRESYLALHHRLDVDTSGLMLFCKKKSLNKEVGELFSKRKIQKSYHALCHYSSEFKKTKWEVKNFLKQIDKKSLKRHSAKSGGDFAHSTFEILSHDLEKKTALILSMPHTGRTHQLRVHLSEEGLPIVGDRVYGIETEIDKQPLQLHCKKLSFHHPVTGELIEVIDRY